MIKIDIKPLSVNEAFQGRRFKTKKYKSYERKLLYLLPEIQLPEEPFSIRYEFGLSSKLADIDNPVKSFTDILQKRYKFNDRDITHLEIRKYHTKKGKEFIKFEILTDEQNQE